MDASWSCCSKREDVVSRRRNGQNNVVRLHVKESSIDAAILPRECIDILFFELLVLLKHVIVVDSPVTVLIPACRQRQLVAQIYYCGLVCLRPAFVVLHRSRYKRIIASLKVKCGKKRRFGCCCVDFSQSLFGRASFSRASHPDVVRNADSKGVVALVHSQNCTESVFEIVL